MNRFLIVACLFPTLAFAEGQYQPRLLPLPGKMVAAQQQSPHYTQRYGNSYARPVQAPTNPLYPAAAPSGYTLVAQVPTAGYNATPVYSGTPSYTENQPAADPMQKPWYVGVKGDIRMLEDWDYTSNDATEFDTGLGFHFLGGRRFNEYLRAELEAGYSEHDVKDGGAFNAGTVIANGYVDYPIAEVPGLAPYVGAGVGGLWQRNGAEENGVVYQLMTGLGYEDIASGAAIAVGYKFQQAPSIFEQQS